MTNSLIFSNFLAELLVTKARNQLKVSSLRTQEYAATILKILLTSLKISHETETNIFSPEEAH